MLQNYGSQLRIRRAVSAKTATEKEMSATDSKRDQMVGPEKIIWETRNLDTALQNWKCWKSGGQEF